MQFNCVAFVALAMCIMITLICIYQNMNEIISDRRTIYIFETNFSRGCYVFVDVNFSCADAVMKF